MAKSGLKHIDVGPELTKTEWESEESHELLHGTSFPGSPVERQLFYRDDEHKWYIYDGSAWVWLGGGSGGGMEVHGNEYHDPDFATEAALASHAAAATGVHGLDGRRNIIINGGFTINQRLYVSAATLAAGVYGHDRWKAGAGGGNYSFTQLASPTTITIAANKTLIQVVEDKMVYGGTYILSWTGTCQARYGLNSATPSGSYASSPIIITGQNAGTTMSVEFGNGAASGTLGLVQLERGSVPTPFEFRPIQQELALCQRYYLKMAYGAYLPPRIRSYGSAGAYAGASYTFPTEMRTTPTCTKNGTWYVSNCGQPSFGSQYSLGFFLEAQVTALGNIAFWPADATCSLEFNAEL